MIDIIRNDDADSQIIIADIKGAAGFTDQHRIADIVFLFKRGDIIFFRNGRQIISEFGGSGIGNDLFELINGNLPDGIPNSESGQQQCRTAGNTDNRHKETFLIPKDVPGGDFSREGHLFP
ncbi:hypothetical protein SDC9_162228 [bioreactor metagenome]|uniref:Uncharacterized protein n=1 Tax=bioreactor metagenome TaxID=1076179 RepID=A0A645FNI2_9ZZZZ